MWCGEHLGNLGRAATPVVPEIADLMVSSNPCVSQEAAKSLGKLGPVAEPALPQLVQQVEKVPSDATTWFAIEAIGKIGGAARDRIPVLMRRRDSEPEMFRGTVQRAIDAIQAGEPGPAATNRRPRQNMQQEVVVPGAAAAFADAAAPARMLLHQR